MCPANRLPRWWPSLETPVNSRLMDNPFVPEEQRHKVLPFCYQSLGVPSIQECDAFAS